MLERARRGKGGVLLVEGEPGAGKTLLLAAAGQAAGADGLVVAASAANELASFSPLAVLPAALPAGPALPRPRASPVAGVPVRSLRGQLEELASAGPALVTLDDVHWAEETLLDEGAENEAADAAETIDCNFDGHGRMRC